MTDGAGDDQASNQSVGQVLASERARQKLDLQDIAARTRVPIRHLEAIEAGDYASLPALPYSAGFVKSYGNMLGLDGIALSKSFREDLGHQQRSYFEPEAYEPADPSRIPSRLLAMVALGIALLFGVVYLLLRFEGDNSELAKLAADTPEEIQRPVAAPPPAAAPAATPAEPVNPSGPITVTASEDVWIKISDRAIGTLYMNVMKAGESFSVPDGAVDPTLRTGRPQVVKVAIGETVLPPIGEPDRLVRAYDLRRDTLVAIATGKPLAEAPAPVAESASPPAERRPRRPRRQRPAEDPSGSRPDTAQPISDDTDPARP